MLGVVQDGILWVASLLTKMTSRYRNLWFRMSLRLDGLALTAPHGQLNLVCFPRGPEAIYSAKRAGAPSARAAMWSLVRSYRREGRQTSADLLALKEVMRAWAGSQSRIPFR